MIKYLCTYVDCPCSYGEPANIPDTAPRVQSPVDRIQAGQE